MAQYAMNYINKRYATNITIKKLDLSWFGIAQLNEIEIQDHHQNTLIYVDNLQTSLINVKKIIDNKVNLGKASLTGVQFYLKIYEGESVDNLTIFIDSFRDDQPKDILNPFILNSELIHLKELNFMFFNENKDKHLQFSASNTSAEINDFSIVGSTVSMKVKNMKLTENRGVNVTSLETDFLYTKTHMEFNNTVLKTDNKTRIVSDIKLNYNRKDLVDFNDKVKIKAKFKKSDIAVRDLNKLYYEICGNDIIHFTGKIDGVLNDFNATDVKIHSKNGMKIIGDFGFINSINRDRGFVFNADIENVKANYFQLKDILPNLLGKSLPSELQRLGYFKMTGVAKIDPNQIKAKLTLNSAIGKVISDLKFSNIDRIDFADYEGKMIFDNFNIGIFANDPLFGKISLEADVKGSGFIIEKINTSILGTISSLEFNQYQYKNLDVNGQFEKKKFKGKLDSKDENFLLQFKGLADFSSEINKFDFEADMAKVDLKKTNLFNRDSISELKGKLVLDISGNTLDDIVGDITFENFQYQNQKDRYNFKKFAVNSFIKDDIKSIEVNSDDIIEGKLEGNFLFKELLLITQNALGSVYTNYEPFEISENQFLKFDFKIHNKIIDVFFPKVSIGGNTRLKGRINSVNNAIRLDFSTPKINIYGNIIKNIALRLNNKNPVFNTHLTADKVSTKYYKIEKLNLLNRTERDTLFFKSEFKVGKQRKENLELNLFYTINQDKKGVIGFQKSELSYKGSDWTVNPKEDKNNKVTFNFNDNDFFISPFLLVSNQQKIEFEGSVKGMFDRVLKANFERVKLKSFLPEIDSLKLNGLFNGKLSFNQTQEDVSSKAKISVDRFKINNIDQGNLDLKIIGDDSYNKFDVAMSLNKKGTERISAKGNLDFSKDRPEMDIDVSMNEYEINAFSPLGKEVLSNLRGAASGEFNAKGIIKNPNFKGGLRIEDAGLTFPYLNIDFDLKGNTNIELEGQQFKFKNTILEDTKYKSKGNLSGYIAHQNFEMWFLDLDIITDNLLILDTEESEEIPYYGTGFLKGFAEITGLTSNLDIEVNAQTQPGTVFVIPLSNIKTVDNYKLIHFEKKVDEIEEKERLIEDIKGLDLRIKLDVTKDALAQVVIDKVLGSELKGRGHGNLSIDINTRGRFNMVGDFNVDQGLYNFKYAGITKPFVVQKGGTISWSGNPYEAELDITAVYSTKANPAQILDNVSSSRKIPIDLYTKITGGLFGSKQEFDIKIPNANSNVSSELEFVLNENDLNTKMQHFSFLLAFGTFYNEEAIGTSATTGLTGTASEIASGILSSMLNSEDDKFQVGVGYTQGERGNIDNRNNIDDLVDVSVSTQLSDKVIVNGTVGVPVGNNTQTNVVGEVKVELLLNEEGNFRGTVFNRQNDVQYSIDDEGYTQGVGLSYQVNFNNLKGLGKKLGLKDKKLKKKDTIARREESLIQFKKKKNN